MNYAINCFGILYTNLKTQYIIIRVVKRNARKLKKKVFR